MNIVITTCTNRKRKPVEDALCASSLPSGPIAGVADRWGQQLRGEAPRFPAREVYAGRAFQDASEAAQKVGGKLLIVSAGLGLIDAFELIPAYACTVLDAVPDSISGRVEGGFSRSGWWREVMRVSPFHLRLDTLAQERDALILAALSDSYIEMVSEDLLALPQVRLSHLRIFSRTPLARIPDGLRGQVMPYDDRLDGPDSPIRGTRSDFAARALRHFAERVLPIRPDASTLAHADAVREALGDWRLPRPVVRLRLDDGDIVRLLRKHWLVAGGSTARLLRLFRDELKVSCEQGRFAALARQVRAEQS